MATELLTEAKGVESPPEGEGEPIALPEKIARSRQRMEHADAELIEVLRPEVAPAKVKKEADRVIDNAWSAFYNWLSGWCKLPISRNPLRERCDHLFAICFFEGLIFTLRAYKIEWQDSDNRIKSIDKEGHRQTISDLGGDPFIAEIDDAHAFYGKVLGITAPRSPAEVATLGSKRDALLAAIRDYVTRVTAHAEPDDPGSQELVDRLLRPLVEWETTPIVPAEPAPVEPTPG
jgi:hypothetical protein